MINLHELLGIAEENFCDYKVHFATGSFDKKKPYNEFLIDGFKNWQEKQTNKNFGRKYILSLIYYDKDVWLFGGVYKVLPIAPKPIKDDKGWNGWKYETELTDKAVDYIGRAIFKFKKEFRVSYLVVVLELKNGEIIDKIRL